MVEYASMSLVILMCYVTLRYITKLLDMDGLSADLSYMCYFECYAIAMLSSDYTTCWLKPSSQMSLIRLIAGFTLNKSPQDIRAILNKDYKYILHC